ncbi:Rhs-family protein [Methylocaldum marinum]|uniref:Rhs-family protein n=1 Tax=Methylocaldum marinum TaxID=1432792 RepID=A0A250KZA9_9GAMM|nr:Rhs-family protein [Methylocaldum marinum]
MPTIPKIHAHSNGANAKCTAVNSKILSLIYVIKHYHPDGLGSLLALTNATGSITATQRFDAFGQKLAGTGTVPTYGYTGREPDATGLVYYRARYYDPSIGRFTARDPVGYLDGLNRYAYVGNNPINFTDPNGLLMRRVEMWWDTQAKGIVNDYGGTAADVGVGFTPVGIYADVYGAATGKTLFGGQELSGWERALGLIPGVSEIAGVVRGVNKVDNIVGAIKYGNLDTLNRPTGVSATITPDMIGTGTKANPTILPPGYVTDSGMARGHLLGAQLGGSGDDVRNLVTIQQTPANSPVMRGFENQVRAAVEGGQNVNLQVTPVYQGNNPIPCGITMCASGSGGFNLDVTILNPPGR